MSLHKVNTSQYQLVYALKYSTFNDSSLVILLSFLIKMGEIIRTTSTVLFMTDFHIDWTELELVIKTFLKYFC